MTKIHPEPVEIMTPIAEVPRLEAEASRNEEANRTARAFQRVMSREMMESLAYSVPKFDGKLEDWLIFRHFFVNRVHLIEEFTDTEKLLFLRHCVVGELGEQVARIGVSGANYSCAWAMIQGKFENKERELKARHMSLLLDLPEMAQESAEGLVFLIDNTRRHLQALRMINVNIPHDFLVVSLTKKLDPHTQFEWKSAIKDREPTVEEMLEFLMKKVKFIEEISRVIEQKRQRGEEGAYCVLCGSPDHYLYQCYLFNEWPVKDRIKFVENVGVCKKCLREHYVAECKFRNCYRCDGEHNVILHQDYQEPPLNASQQVVVTPRLNLKHFSTMNDEATSDEGISESGDSVSSQEEKYEYRQENKIEIVHDVRIPHEAQIQPEVQTESEVQAEPEVHIEHYIDHEGVFRGSEDILSPEISQPEKQNRQIEDGAYNVHHNAVPPGTGIVEMLSEGTHKGVSQGQESRMYPTPIVKEEQNRESYKDAHQKDQIVILPEATNPENQNREYHENACQGDNNIAPAESVSQEDQFRDPQEEICQNNQNVVPLEAAVQEEQSMRPHLEDCHENQNLLPPETDDDDDEQEISIICQKTQNLDLHSVAYQEPTFEPQVSVCQQGGQNILVPPMVYQQAQYVAPPEVTYQVEGQNVMPHSMVYPQVQYDYPPEETYDVADQNISPPEMVYQPMQYVCSHMAPYQVDGQMMMPSGVIYQPEQYVVPPEQAYQQDDQNMVVYQPVQYMDPQVVNQDPQVVNQAISADSIMYGVPYYAAAQPLQQQQNMNIIHQQHAMQHQQAFQQQQMMQQQQQVMQHQQVMQPQHVIHPHHAMQQQHIIHHQPQQQQQQHHIIHHQPQQQQQQQHIIHHQPQQQQQQQHIIHHQPQQQQHIVHHQPQQQQQQQQHVIPRDYNIVQQPIRQVVIQQEANVINQEGNNEQQGAHALQQQQGDENRAENNLQIVGRLRPDAEPFEPKVADGNKDVLLFASEGEVYVLSRLNYNAQEFVPQGQQPHEENPREVKSKIKQYLSRVVALLV